MTAPVLAVCNCFWPTPALLSFLQAASLLQRPTPLGGDHVQREHAALAAADAVRQVPQRAGGHQPRGPGHFGFSVRLEMTASGNSISHLPVRQLSSV